MFITSEIHRRILKNVLTLRLKLVAKHANLSVCRSSGQTKDEFENFIKNLILNTLQTKAHS